MPRRIFLFCILLLALAALYTLASVWITVERIGRLDAAGKATAQSQQVLSALHAFATAAVDIESSARGYALTGNEAYLQPFEAARRQAPLRLDELRDLMRDEPKQLARVERLTGLLAERIAISDHGIAQKRTAPDEPFVMRFGSRGRESSDEIRRTVEDIEADERQDLAARKNVWQQELERARTTEALSALSSLTVITLSLWALLRLRRSEAPAPAASVAAAAAPAPPAPMPEPAADFDTLVDETLRRAALLQSSSVWACRSPCRRLRMPFAIAKAARYENRSKRRRRHCPRHMRRCCSAPRIGRSLCSARDGAAATSASDSRPTTGASSCESSHRCAQRRRWTPNSRRARRSSRKRSAPSVEAGSGAPATTDRD